MNTKVRRNDDKSRYELCVEDRLVSIAEYRVVDETVVFTHTETEQSMRGRGMAARVVQFALDDVRDGGRKVVARCAFVRSFIADNSQYTDLLAA